MPYINRDRRLIVADKLQAKTPGELNYLLSQMIRSYLATFGESYTTFNAVVGVLECLKMEIYRRKIALYEDVKMSESGDVF